MTNLAAGLAAATGASAQVVVVVTDGVVDASSGGPDQAMSLAVQQANASNASGSRVLADDHHPSRADHHGSRADDHRSGADDRRSGATTTGLATTVAAATGLLPTTGRRTTDAVAIAVVLIAAGTIAIAMSRRHGASSDRH